VPSPTRDLASLAHFPAAFGGLPVGAQVALAAPPGSNRHKEDVMQRRLCLGILMGLGLASAGAMTTACSSGGASPSSEETGVLSVPLSTHGPSGAEYRLRDAVFEIRSEYDYYDDYTVGGLGPSGSTYTLSSEDDPTASSLSLSVERGYYYVRLLPGWHMEKIESGVTTAVEATLLSPATQWLYVNARSTSWIEYQFGIGDRALWFNGNLNIDVQVYEDPSQYYGNDAGAGGDSGVGGNGGFAGTPQGAGGV
jgi:hypothetical protein